MPTLPDDAARLASLRHYGVLDAASDPELNDIAAIAAVVCGTPSGMVSFVDADRQWFRGRSGITLTGTSRDVSFCARAIANPLEIFVVEDTWADPRFASNPLVVGEPYIRFYAGVPLVSRERAALGTLCVVDSVPRHLSDEQRTSLSGLRYGVMAILELRRTRDELRQAVSARDRAIASLEQTREGLQRTVADRTSALTRILERIGDAFVALDADWCYTYVNARAAAMFGREADALIGRHIWTEFPEGVGQPFYHAYQRAMREQTPQRIEEYYPPWRRWFENRIYPSADGLSIFFTDTTDIKAARQAAEHAQAQLRLAIAASDTGLWDWDLVTNAVFFSPEWKKQLGYTDEELPNEFAQFESRLHPDDAADVLQKVSRYLADPRGDYELEFRLRHRDGSYRWIYTRAAVVLGPTGRPVRMLGSHVDVSRRKAEQLELERSREDLRHLSADLLRTREDERARVAREIHDELGQELTALKMDIAWLQRRLPAADAVGAKLHDVAAALDGTVGVVRRIATDLRPGVLDDLGLAAAIEWLVDDFRARSEIACHAEVDLQGTPDAETSIALFRIAQESLTNVARHAGARRVDLRLTSTAEAWYLTVTDDGRGIAAAQATGGLGLTGMRERAHLIGAALSVEPRPEGGTVVSLRVPRRAEGT